MRHDPPRSRFSDRTIGLAILGFAVAIVLAYGFLPHGRPIRWEVPGGYTGWVLVQYGDPSCPPLQTDGLYLVVTVSPDGQVCTSDPPTLSVRRHHRYEYVYPDGSRVQIFWTRRGEGGTIWGKFTDSRRRREAFFVGSEEQFEQSRGTGPRLRE